MELNVSGTQNTRPEQEGEQEVTDFIINCGRIVETSVPEIAEIIK